LIRRTVKKSSRARASKGYFRLMIKISLTYSFQKGRNWRRPLAKLEFLHESSSVLLSPSFLQQSFLPTLGPLPPRLAARRPIISLSCISLFQLAFYGRAGSLGLLLRSSSRWRPLPPRRLRPTLAPPQVVAERAFCSYCPLTTAPASPAWSGCVRRRRRSSPAAWLRRVLLP